MGYVCAPPELLAAMRKVHQYTIMSAPTPAQWAAIEAIEAGEPHVADMVAEYDRRRRLLVGGLNSLGLDCFEPKGAFYAFPSVARSGMSEVAFADAILAEEQVAVVPGSAFGAGGEGYVRLSYATAYEKLERALERFANFMRRYG
jgi:aminotransferase